MLKFVSTNRDVSSDLVRDCLLALGRFNSRTDIGFAQLPLRDELWEQSMKWGRHLAAEAETLILIGIGGSSLGPQFLADVAFSKKQVFVADNVDPWQFSKITSQVRNWEKTWFVVVSKSGSTLETLFTTDLFIQHLKERGLELSSRCLVITEPRENSLSNWADEKGVPTLDLPLDVGGRFSILSPVGMLVAEALGLDTRQIREGAAEACADHQAIAQMAAEAISSFDRQEWITFVWTYSSALKYFGAWFSQLWAESLGKKLDSVGQPAPRVSSPFYAVGTCDQHSVFQQVMEGARDKWVLQIRVESCENGGPLSSKSEFSELNWLKGPTRLGQVLAAEAEGTCQALVSEDVSIRVMKLKDLGPKSVGYLLMFWQIVVACIGEQLSINAFNQPGVELGKRLAKEILKK